jgi:hypothetical protein
VQPVDARRRSRLSELVLGVVIVAVFGLGVVLWHTSTTSGQSALVLARPVKAGEELHADAVRTETVRLGTTVAHVDAADAPKVLGRVATADLAAGTLVAPALFVARPAIPAGAAVVAAALTPGQFASFGLRPGQAVLVLGTADKAAAGQVITHAAVFEVHDLGDTTGTRVVSLLVPEGDAAAVASAAAAKAVSLALEPGA